MSHAPGPWRVSNNELGYASYDILWDDGLGNPNIGIATVVDARFCNHELGTVALDRDMCQDNANLIAAAPDQNEALIDIKSIAENPQYRTRMTQKQMCDFLDNVILPIASRALVKVEGGGNG